LTVFFCLITSKYGCYEHGNKVDSCSKLGEFLDYLKTYYPFKKSGFNLLINQLFNNSLHEKNNKNSLIIIIIITIMSVGLEGFSLLHNIQKALALTQQLIRNGYWRFFTRW